MVVAWKIPLEPPPWIRRRHLRRVTVPADGVTARVLTRSGTVTVTVTAVTVVTAVGMVVVGVVVAAVAAVVVVVTRATPA